MAEPVVGNTETPKAVNTPRRASRSGWVTAISLVNKDFHLGRTWNEMLRHRAGSTFVQVITRVTLRTSLESDGGGFFRWSGGCGFRSGWGQAGLFNALYMKRSERMASGPPMAMRYRPSLMF